MKFHPKQISSVFDTAFLFNSSCHEMAQKFRATAECLESNKLSVEHSSFIAPFCRLDF